MPSSSPPLISTIIPVFNRAEMLKRAVNSVLEQRYRPLEIIVVNDGSTDETAMIADQLMTASPECVTVLHIENGGPGLAREAGRLYARGDFIQYLDSDDWLLPNKFADQIEMLRKEPDADIVYGITQLVNSHGDILNERSKETGVARTSLFPALLVDRWWHTSTPIYSKRISDLAGPWSNTRPEDWDLEARMGVHNPKLAFVEKAVSCHLEHDEPGRVSKGEFTDYLLQEAVFLPRLYDCAIKAGVKKQTAEMQHFSKWTFMRARYLGAYGETALARKLFILSLAAATAPSLFQKVAQFLAPLVGWQAIGKASLLLEKIR